MTQQWSDASLTMSLATHRKWNTWTIGADKITSASTWRRQRTWSWTSEWTDTSPPPLHIRRSSSESDFQLWVPNWWPHLEQQHFQYDSEGTPAPLFSQQVGGMLHLGAHSTGVWWRASYAPASPCGKAAVLWQRRRLCREWWKPHSGLWKEVYPPPRTYTSHRKRASCIMKDPTHPAHTLFVPLQSGRSRRLH